MVARKIENDEQLLCEIEPNTVNTTENKIYPFPISNRLFLHIGNPKNAPARTFVNDQGLTPYGDLPGIDDEVDAEYNLSRFYIWFPWGEEEGDLCTLEQSGNITVSPGPHNDSWYVVRMSDSTIGTYWILFPKEQTALQPEESVTFVLDNIVTTTGIGMSWMYIRNQKILDYEDGQQDLIVSKRLHPFEFAANPFEVAQSGKSILHWITPGAKKCTLDPGNVFIEFAGKKEVNLDKTTSYTLNAEFDNNPSIQLGCTVYVRPVNIKSFSASPDTQIKAGEPVTLSWNVEFASSCSITPAPTEQPNGNTVVVYPENTTTYELKCEGFDGPKTKTLIVEVASVEIEMFSADTTVYMVEYPGDPVQLFWVTAGAASCRIDPDVGSIDCDHGSIKVQPKTTTTYELICEGPNGPAASTLKVVVKNEPKVNLYQNRYRGMSVYLNWSTEYCVRCHLKGGTYDEDVALQNVQDGGLASGYDAERGKTYTLTGWDNRGNSVESTIKVE